MGTASVPLPFLEEAKIDERTVRRVTGVFLAVVGGVLAFWHATVLVTSLGLPAVALLGTTVLLALSTVLVGLGATVFVGNVDGVIAVRIVAWMVVTGTAFATVGFLVALHLAAMVGQFDGVPLIADLLTVGAAMGVLIGRYDGRNRQYQERIRA